MSIGTLFHPKILRAQIVLSGVVADPQNNKIADASIEVLGKDNLQLIKHAVSDSLGLFRLEITDSILSGYTFIISHVGYYNSYIRGADIKDTFLEIQLEANSGMLQSVNVTGTKPDLERKSDRFSFKITKTSSTGSNGWELLSETPLVRTNEQGGISINGTEGVNVLINEKNVYLSGEALMNYLKNISRENIESIEIITIPSSKYDANGNGGILNIVKKKNDSKGLSGTLSAGSKFATYASPSVSSSINYNRSKLNVSLGISAVVQNLMFGAQNKVSFEESANPYALNINDIRRRLKNKTSVSPNAQLEYNIDSTSNVSANISYNHDQLTRINNINSSYFDVDLNKIDSLNRIISKDEEKSSFSVINASYKKQLDTLKSYIIIGTDYFKYDESRAADQKGIYTNQYTDSLTLSFLNRVPLSINNHSLNVDFRKNSARQSFEAGLRFAKTLTSSETAFKKFESGEYIIDPALSNLFKYREEVTAAYVNYIKPFSELFDMQVGTRLEHFKSRADQVDNHQLSKNAKLFILPSLFLNYEMTKNALLTYAFSSRVNRPSFWDVNPYRYYYSPAIYSEGNPFLVPARIFKNEITLTLKRSLVIQTTFAKTKNAFSSLNTVDDENIIFRKYNYGTIKQLGFNITYSTRLKPFWYFRINSNNSYQEFKGSYNSYTFAISGLYAHVSLVNGLTISKKKGLYSTVFINDYFPHYSENTYVKNQYQVNIMFRKNLLRENSYISISFSDVFKSSVDRYQTNLNTRILNEKYYYDNRSISVGLSYSFGSPKVRGARVNESRNEDNQNRIK